MAIYLVVILTSLAVSALTLFSGFGLGTLLMPVLAVFFPVHVAIAATAMVHGGNNLFKVGLFRTHADWGAVVRFGLPAMGAALLGAGALAWVTHVEPIATYTVAGSTATVTPVKLVVAALMIAFAMFELHPRLRDLEIKRRHLFVGGLASGFFGGFSGHQGALRSAFLAKLDTTAKTFVATNAVIGLLVDAARLTVYGAAFLDDIAAGPGWGLVATATLAAFAGVLVSRRLLDKITIRFVRVVTGTLLLVLAAALASGWL